MSRSKVKNNGNITIKQNTHVICLVYKTKKLIPHPRKLTPQRLDKQEEKTCFIHHLGVLFWRLCISWKIGAYYYYYYIAEFIAQEMDTKQENKQAKMSWIMPFKLLHTPANPSTKTDTWRFYAQSTTKGHNQSEILQGDFQTDRMLYHVTQFSVCLRCRTVRLIDR